MIHVRKTGGTSLELAWGESDNNLFATREAFEHNRDVLRSRVLRPFATDKHTPLRAYKKNLHPDYFSQLRIVRTVRNPWNRVVSMCMWSLKKMRLLNGDSGCDREALRATALSLQPISHYLVLHEWQVWPILSVLRNPLSTAPVNHCISQESLEDDYATVCTRLGLEARPLPRVNSSWSTDWRSQYDDETWELVRSRFRHEIAYFGYRFES